MKKSYQVRVSFDKNYETLKEFNFDENKSAAESFFEKTVKRIDRIGYGTSALFYRSVYLEKSYRLRKHQ